MQKNSINTKKNNIQLVMIGILVVSSIISLGLFAARDKPSPFGPYSSLVLNLYLAWVPFWFAWVIYKFANLPNMMIRVMLSLCALFWFLFFPNSLYILTDFQHVAIKDTDTPVWYDVIMLLWFSWSGLILGMLSLYWMQNVVARLTGKASVGWIFAVIASVLGSIGVYLGRFTGINSWDPIINQKSMLDVLQIHFQYPPYQLRMMQFSFLFALFFLFVYVSLFIFGKMINEQDKQK